MKAKAAQKGSLDAPALQQLIAKRYPAPEYAAFFEVGSSPNAGPSRIADAVIMGLWPSRGHYLIGFEIKTSRQDFVREMKTPEKAERIAPYCDFWYMVVSGMNVVGDDTIPQNWGLLVASERGDRLVEVKSAEKTASVLLKPIDRKFMASLLRKANDKSARQREIEAAKGVGYSIGYDHGKKVSETIENANMDGLARENRLWKEAVEGFQRAAGIEIRQYQGENIGADFAAFINLRARIAQLGNKFGQIEKDARGALESLRTVISIMTESGNLVAGTGYEAMKALYENDTYYHRLVDSIAQQLETGVLTPKLFHDAVELANFKHTEKIRSKFVAGLPSTEMKEENV